MMPSTVKWIRFSLFNLLLVALLGILMRYKIGFPFPYFDQKHLQHAHSHFAFYGWVSHTLMTLMAAYIHDLNQGIPLKRYNSLIALNLMASYGMLFSFTAWGYHAVSISFSVLSVLVSYAFTAFFIRDFRPMRIRSGVSLWFRAALLFNVLSSLGTFALAYMMATKQVAQQAYLLSVYFYLHFQYNGWFFFTSVGLAILLFRKLNPDFHTDRRVFWMFALSVVPAYLLSALWLPMPGWVYALVVAAAVVQSMAWVMQFSLFAKEYRNNLQRLLPEIRLGLWVVGFAICIKFLLQLGSVIPELAKLAFGFRPVIIAYLHLVLLAITSVFLLLAAYAQGYVQVNRKSKRALILFMVSVYLNEAVLALQGVASFAYFRFPMMNEILFAVSVLIGLAVTALFLSQRKPKHDINHL